MTGENVMLWLHLLGEFRIDALHSEINKNTKCFVGTSTLGVILSAEQLSTDLQKSNFQDQNINNQMFFPKREDCSSAVSVSDSSIVLWSVSEIFFGPWALSCLKGSSTGQESIITVTKVLSSYSRVDESAPTHRTHSSKILRYFVKQVIITESVQVIFSKNVHF